MSRKHSCGTFVRQLVFGSHDPDSTEGADIDHGISEQVGLQRNNLLDGKILVS